MIILPHLHVNINHGLLIAGKRPGINSHPLFTHHLPLFVQNSQIKALSMTLPAKIHTDRVHVIILRRYSLQHGFLLINHPGHGSRGCSLGGRDLFMPQPQRPQRQKKTYRRHNDDRLYRPALINNFIHPVIMPSFPDFTRLQVFTKQ